MKLDRKTYLKKVKRAVIKIGSGVLTRKNGLNLNLIDDLATEVCRLRNRGIEIILVSSGAIAAGLEKGRSIQTSHIAFTNAGPGRHGAKQPDHGL